jgi:hypothetical protein
MPEKIVLISQARRYAELIRLNREYIIAAGVRPIVVDAVLESNEQMLQEFQEAA